MYNSECAQFSLSPVAVPAVFNSNVWGLWDPLTYGGSGNLLDSSGFNHDFVISNTNNTLSYSSRNRGKFVCTGVDISNGENSDGFNLSNNLSTGTYTFFYAGRLTGTKNERIMSGINNNWLLGPWHTYTNTYWGGSAWIYPAAGPTGGPLVETTWKIHTGTANVGAGQYSYYNNGALLATNANGISGPDGLTLFNGGAAYPQEHSAGETGIVVIWDKILSDAEVFEAYEYYRTRYGI